MTIACADGLVAHDYEVDGGTATSYTITEGPDLICSDCVSLLEEDSKHQEQHADDQLMKGIGKGWAIRAVWIGIILAICIPCQVNFPEAAPYIAGLRRDPDWLDAFNRNDQNGETPPLKTAKLSFLFRVV
jgi:hypothetical protein